MLQQVSSTNLVSLFGSLALLSTWVYLLQSRNECLATDWQETRLFGAHFYPVLAIARRSSSNLGVTMRHLWRCLPSPHPLSSEDSVLSCDDSMPLWCKCHKWLHRLCDGRDAPQQCRWDSNKNLQVWQPVAGLWGTTSEQPRLICPSPVLQKAFADGWPWSTRKSTEACFSAVSDSVRLML